MNMKMHLIWFPLVVISVLASCQSNNTQVVNLYTDRHYDTDQVLFDQFTAATGIEVNVLKLEADPLLVRLQTEGDLTPADAVFLTDAGRLGKAKSLDLLQPTSSSYIDQVVDPLYQDDDQHWVALTKRARVFVYHPDRIQPEDLSTYEALVDAEMKGRVVTRSSSNVYNQSLVAAMIAEHGLETTRIFTDGLVENFAIRDSLSGSTSPSGNDRDQAKAVYAGIGDVAIMNTYYLGRLLFSSDPLERSVAETLEVFFPNQSTYGTHINVSGIGITKHTRRKANAIALVEFLLSLEAQDAFASANFEYPIHRQATIHPLLTSWGTFIEQDVALSKLYTYADDAFQLMIESGWN